MIHATSFSPTATLNTGIMANTNKVFNITSDCSIEHSKTLKLPAVMMES